MGDLADPNRDPQFVPSRPRWRSQQRQRALTALREFTLTVAVGGLALYLVLLALH